MRTVNTDVVVVGAGNAGLVGALAASEAGARVILLEAAPEAERGGNSRFAGGIFRATHDGLESLLPLLTPESQKWSSRVNVGPYTAEAFASDWMATSEGRPDPALVATVVDGSRETLEWMRTKGVQFELTVGKLFDLDEGIEGESTYDMVPGGAIRAAHEGVGLIASLFAAAEADDTIEIWYSAPAASLIVDGSSVKGVRVRYEAEFVDVFGEVVLAAGGFEANPEMRLRYLGTGWDTVKVRGSRFNMGTMLSQALMAGAQPSGHWEGCHASPLDNDAPAVGDLRFTDKYSRYSYPYALLVNRQAERFIDEGENQVWLTYAKTGAAIRSQRSGIAHQIFDNRTVHLLEPRYSTTPPIVADTLEELAVALDLDPHALAETVSTFNAAVDESARSRFDPYHLDSVSARPEGQPNKSNWAQPLDAPPYTAYTVTCGITFTYGGLRADASARVLDTEGRPMPGLYAVGEIAGGFFYYNYAGGAGLMRGAVFGRIAGTSAAERAAGR